MCGIVGYVGPKDVVSVILEGLRRLEYRGYDSAGIAVGSCGTWAGIAPRPGKAAQPGRGDPAAPAQGTYGIGHTRWATHGRPTEENAHPHRDCTGRIVVVHNGIVENYLELKRELAGEGHTFVTETDTEVIAHLIEQELRSAENSGKTMLLEDAVRRAARRLTGAYAISVISADAPDTIVTARNGPPAVVGVGEGESFVASDVPGILHHTRMMYFLADGDVAILTPARREVHQSGRRPGRAQGGEDSLGPHPGGKGRLQALHAEGDFGAAAGCSRHHSGPHLARDRRGFPGRDADHRRSLSCGDPGEHRGLRDQLAFRPGGQVHDRAAGEVPVEVDYASEYRYRDPIADPNALGMLITQSGETADTLAAQREMVARDR